MTEMTMIPVAKATRERLKQFGIKGDTYDTIIRGLLDEKEEKQGG